MYTKAELKATKKDELINKLLTAQDSYLELKQLYTDLRSKHLNLLAMHKEPKPTETKSPYAASTPNSEPLNYKVHEVPYTIQQTGGTLLNPEYSLCIDHEDRTYKLPIKTDKFLYFIQQQTKDDKLLVTFTPWEKNPNYPHIDIIKR